MKTTNSEAGKRADAGRLGEETRRAEAATIPLADPERQDPCEYTEVEYPMLVQLAGMGWKYLHGDLDYPEKTEREHFRETLLRPRLRAAIRKLNLDPQGHEYLDDVTIDRAIRELERTESQALLERNKELSSTWGWRKRSPRGSGAW